MLDTEKALRDAISAYYPSVAIRAAVKRRILPHSSGIQLVSVHQNSAQIMRKVFRRCDKLMRNIA